MRLRRLLVIAILAALHVAPSPASAAPNELSAPTVSPQVGTTDTDFTFRIDYDGRFPATAVGVQVAARSVAMTMASGTAESGTWGVTTSLPAGVWPVTFIATTDSGNSPSLIGPTVTVAPAASADPLPRSDPPATSTPVLEGPMSADTGTVPEDPPETAPIAAPDAPDGPAESEIAPETAPQPSEVPVPRAGDVDPSSATADARSAEPVGASDEGMPESTLSGHPAERPSAAAAPNASVAHSMEPAVDATTTTPAGDDTLVLTLMLGMAGVAAVALVGTMLLLAGRRRSRRAAEAPVRAAILDDGPSSVARRAARRVRLQLADDPIVASLGAGGDQDARRRSRRAARAERGPAVPGDVEQD